jgi:crotonobetainyl-CoA:carnitine CoA-transferase CaiB-like acyl-CoA transferase
MTALDGLLVFDLGDAPSGRFAARIFADYGARVIRLVAPRDGDDLSEAERVYARAADLYLDAGKEIVVVDAEAPAGVAAVRDAFARADVVIETLPPGTLAALGIDVWEVLAHRRGLVLTSITPYGQDGPRATWKGSELTLQAAGGFLTLSGDPRREPVQAALDQVHLTGGRVAAVATLAAMLGTPCDATGRWIDVALVEVAASLPPFHIQQYTHTGAIAGRGPEREPPLDGQHVATADGFVTFATGASPFELFSVLLDDPTLMDARFHTPAGRVAHQADLEEIVRRRAGGMTSRQIFDRALGLGIVAGIVQTPRDLLDCPQLTARGYFRPLPEGGRTLRFPGLGINSPDLPPRPLDGSTAEDGRQPRTASPPAAAPSPDPRRPLAGVNVLAFEDVLALPWATVQLARLGATVTRIESRVRIQARHWGVYPDNEPGEEFWNEGGNFCSFYRNKRSVALDLSDRRAAAAVLALAEGADIVVDNFRPGVMERLGLGAGALHARNPALIVVHCSGYGASGPYARMGAFARTIDAMSGLSDLTGYEDGPPVRANPSYMDMVSAWNIAAACLLGLHRRRRTGCGLVIDHSMYEAGVSTVGPALLAAQLGTAWPGRQGNGHVRHVPQGIYPCAGGRCIAITVAAEDEWQRLADLAGQPWQADPRFAHRRVRQAHRRDLNDLIARWTAAQDAFALERRLQDAGIAAAVVRDARDLLLDEQLRARRFFEWIRTPTDRIDYVRPYAGSPFRFVGEPVRHGIAARMGADNEAVLTGDGKVGVDELREMATAGIVGQAPVAGVTERPRPLDIEAMRRRLVLAGHDPSYGTIVAGLYRESHMEAPPALAGATPTPPLPSLGEGAGG